MTETIHLNRVTLKAVRYCLPTDRDRILWHEPTEEQVEAWEREEER